MSESSSEYVIKPIGFIRSELRNKKAASRQGSEGAPDAWLVVVSWLHLADRTVLQVHPRSEMQNPLTGVFATRSPVRPNPLGLHRVTIREIDGTRLRIGPIEAVDGTPVVD